MYNHCVEVVLNRKFPWALIIFIDGIISSIVKLNLVAMGMEPLTRMYVELMLVLHL